MKKQRLVLDKKTNEKLIVLRKYLDIYLVRTPDGESTVKFNNEVEEYNAFKYIYRRIKECLI